MQFQKQDIHLDKGLLALDVASSEFYKDGKYIVEGDELNSEEMSSFLSNLVDKYPIISIEDGMAESDWEGWKSYGSIRCKDSTSWR